MSWDAYVTNMTTAGAQLCGIYTQKGVVCAQSDGVNISAAEVALIVKCFEKTDSKLEINGAPCFMIRVDENSVTGKTKAATFGTDKVLYHCEFTNSYIVVVGMTGAGERAASGIASNIGTYLKGLGH